MNEPWFDPNTWAWLPGTIFGCIAGLWGAGAGILVPRGKRRSLVLGTGVALLIAAVAFLVAGTAALIARQPYGIWFGLLLPGAIGIFALPFNLLVVWNRYNEAETRRIRAVDLE